MKNETQDFNEFKLEIIKFEDKNLVHLMINYILIKKCKNYGKKMNVLR